MGDTVEISCSSKSTFLEAVEMGIVLCIGKYAWNPGNTVSLSVEQRRQVNKGRIYA